ncbi:SCO7613 C-terminal domain-containing membrane protein, partial [Streptomyces anatolicus]|uniref:SCO7613 C-terminal domain-containing membrane protein n=1 Tax=Streptomyces anatolicus TaxID=2675858 RepID=UPI0035560287
TALLTELPLPHPLLAPLVLALLAATLLAAPSVLGTPIGVRTPGTAPAATASGAPHPPHAGPAPSVSRSLARAVPYLVRYGAPVLGWSALVALPAALRLPYAAGVVVYVLVVAALLAVAARVAAAGAVLVGPALMVSGLALASSVSVAFLALATEAATLGTLGALTALFLAACVQLVRRPRQAPTGVAALAACAALTYATAFACAAGAAGGLRPEQIGVVTLAVPTLAALAAARLGQRPETLPVEVMAAASAALAVALTAGHAPTFALALTLAGLIAAGTALRPDRHRVGYAAGVLFILASWVRLAAWEVSTPEAYTLPVTVPALLLGLLRRRRDSEASSWTAYGPGLAMTLLPSLTAAWGDPHWQRPLLLGLAALALTLAGARHGLRAPLVLGGTVLALDALHELAPYIVQVAGALPRWLPPALAGLLLLAVGATYEQRLRDARRFRNALDRMH